MPFEFIAHVRKSDQEPQLLQWHLEHVASIAKSNAAKLNLAQVGELLGLLHDLGKYSEQFQTYIQSATGLLNPDEDEEYVDAAGLKGKIDHSTAGAQFVWRELAKEKEKLKQIVGQILVLCLVSHHSGLIDCLTTNKSNETEDNFSRRLAKEDSKSHLSEVLKQQDKEIEKRINTIINDETLISGLKKLISAIIKASPATKEKDKSQVVQFKIGLLVRFIFSCLIDADQKDAANFEKPQLSKFRAQGGYTRWNELIRRLEAHLALLKPSQCIDHIRQEISQNCHDKADRERGIFTLTVPTGGGKTLASLRFALHHASKHNLDRIIYVIPFLSIIDQNADVVRTILEPADRPEEKGRVVLENHSNLDPEVQGWREKLLAENWDAPIIFTTSVQFLETLFGSGTRNARRMHQLAKAMIVFDEIQTLPVRCVHIFNNAINFLVDHCGSSVMLCTATQPLLGRVTPEKGALKLTEKSEIMNDVKKCFDSLKRVEVKDSRKKSRGWTEEEIASLALAELQRAGSCLVVVNTKKAAKGLYRSLSGQLNGPLYHLSTSMCPTHRRKILCEIRERLKNEQQVLCVSTQLIEAGVDVDFGAVIRFAAGLDSIAQAAGRCNRHGKRELGIVHIVNPDEDDLKHLKDIKIGRDKTERVLDDFKSDPAQFDGDVIGLKAMEWYYENYFFARKDEMEYSLSIDTIGRTDTLLSLLSSNERTYKEFYRRYQNNKLVWDNQPYLRQSFMTAAKAFQAIDASTQGVIVPYGEEGKTLIAELCAAFEVEKQHALIRRAQQFSVNLFPYEFQKLLSEGVLHEIQEGIRIYYLNEPYYSQEFGLSLEPVTEEEFLHVG